MVGEPLLSPFLPSLHLFPLCDLHGLHATEVKATVPASGE
jgi:hypothetical protein